jgi:hypothetical protein
MFHLGLLPGGFEHHREKQQFTGFVNRIFVLV